MNYTQVLIPKLGGIDSYTQPHVHILLCMTGEPAAAKVCLSKSRSRSRSLSSIYDDGDFCVYFYGTCKACSLHKLEEQPHQL